MRLCNERPVDGYFHCGNGCTINGVRYCSDYGLKVQLDYCGHLFCASLGDDVDEDQLQIDLIKLIF